MIALADKICDIEPRGELFVVTAFSGGEQLKFALTRHMLISLGVRASMEVAKARVADLSAAEIIPFRKTRRRKKAAVPAK